jgi:hypothetical protein
VVAATAGPGARAHHSITRVYDGTQQVTLEGVVTEFRFINPHPFLVVDVSVDGSSESWQLEMDNRVELVRIGVTAETFRPGDRVVVSGSIGRTQPQTLYLRRLERGADGLLYEQRGGTPTIGVGRE